MQLITMTDKPQLQVYLYHTDAASVFAVQLCVMKDLDGKIYSTAALLFLSLTVLKEIIEYKK